MRTKPTPHTIHDERSDDGSDSLADVICQAMLEMKARDVVQLDVRDVTTLANQFIICHGTSETQIGAIANRVDEQTRVLCNEKPWRREGLEGRKWIVLDYVDVVVHIFSEEYRTYYDLEKMWSDGVRTDIRDPEPAG
ncbi:MAG: ribosome silencing factor [Balneolaceae bacterium]